MSYSRGEMLAIIACVRSVYSGFLIDESETEEEKLHRTFLSRIVGKLEKQLEEV